MSLNISEIRDATPGVKRVIHLNHAGGSLAPRRVYDAVAEHLGREMEFGAMEAGASVADRLERVRADAATILGALPGEIAFTQSNSDGWGRAFAALRLAPGARVLVGRAEWSSNLTNMMRAGLCIETMPVDEHGQTCVTRLAPMLDAGVSLVSLTWAPANGGLIEPAAEIGRLVRKAGVPYFVDASQVVGQLPVDVRELGCDVLTTNGRKYLRGPRGVGLLFVRNDFLQQLDPSYVDNLSSPYDSRGAGLEPDARRLAIGDSSVALRLGLGEAIRLALDLGLNEIRSAIRERADQLRALLAAIPGVQTHDLGVERSGLVSFTCHGWSGARLQDALRRRAINIGFNGRNYTPLDMKARKLDEVIRASVTYFTTKDELDFFAGAIAEARRAV